MYVQICKRKGELAKKGNSLIYLSYFDNNAMKYVEIG